MNIGMEKKDFWAYANDLYLVGSNIKCLAGHTKPIDIILPEENLRINDIYWKYDDPNQPLKSLLICEKTPVLKTDGTIDFTKLKVTFFNDGPDDISFTVQAKLMEKVGEIEVKPISS
ncbi:hypothetical protein COC69_23365 [Bacillus cereus]|uniref:Uncharacterized protein n=1 Tax=Bacillus cereus TaxID=1396 RepID=A0A9X7CJM2_BACCE|nr:hypothetical protein [Bacillus cereus]PGS74162.1 hypothetical protein COC69_23365 [Bacillus cereus]